MTQPPYPDLRFNHGVAEEAIAALQSAHQLLSELTSTRGTLAAQALANWKGAYADQFSNEDLPQLIPQSAGGNGRLDGLLAQIEQTIQAVSQASAEATQQAAANAAWRPPAAVASKPPTQPAPAQPRHPTPPPPLATQSPPAATTPPATPTPPNPQSSPGPRRF